MITALLTLLTVSAPAQAGPWLLSSTPDQVPSGRDVGGLNWVRVFNNFDDGGWWLTHHWDNGTGPGYNVAPMTEGLNVDMSSRVRLADWDDIKDHGIERCPDGSFLHVYSLSVTNDSARAARYTDDWNMIAHGWVEENVDARAHNDMHAIIVACACASTCLTAACVQKTMTVFHGRRNGDNTECAEMM